MTEDGGRAGRRLESALLWGLALLSFGLGDLATSLVGISLGMAREASPIIAPLVADFGLPVLVLAKGSMLALSYLGWSVTPTPYDSAIPLGLVAIGVPVTVWNTYIIVMGM